MCVQVKGIIKNISRIAFISCRDHVERKIPTDNTKMGEERGNLLKK
jgi:hypothetical protein